MTSKNIAFQANLPDLLLAFLVPIYALSSRSIIFSSLLIETIKEKCKREYMENFEKEE